MESVVLQQLKQEMAPQITLNCEPAAKRFFEFAQEFNTFDRLVYEHAFTWYLHRHNEAICKAIASIAEKNDELLIQAFVGKLANKLPKIYIPGFEDDYHTRKALMTVAGTIGHILMDTEEFPSSIVKKKVDGKWETLTTIKFGGNPAKDLLKGLHFEPGMAYQKGCEGFRLKKEHKNRLKQLSSVPFKLSYMATKELILKGYTLKPDWNARVDSNGNRLQEHPNTKKERYQGYADTIMALEDETFYLELEYSGSGRMFYKFQLEGMRPQGKLWETLMIDSAEPYYLSESGANALKHLIYCELTGTRVPLSEAVKHFSSDMVQDVLDNYDPMKAEDDEEFGQCILLRKAAHAFNAYLKGKPTHSMFGWDFTNSGLIMAGMSFHSHEMMRAGNVLNQSEVVDSHTQFGEGYNLDISRKDVKRLHMPLLHGSTLGGLMRSIHDITGDKSLTERDIAEKNRAAYGDCVDNLITIADWGVHAVNNKQSKLTWTLPDGFKATHKAYFKSVPVRITAVSCNEAHSKGKTTHTIISDMPYCVDNTGKPLVADAPVKVRGLYANITHSLDAYVLRHITDTLLAAGMPVKLKHDDYMISPESYDMVLQAAREAFTRLYERNLYIAAIEEIGNHSVEEDIEMPVIIMSDAENEVAESDTFLMP